MTKAVSASHAHHSGVRTFESRVEMLSLVPKRGVVAEIGVFDGSFSRHLLDVCDPRELVLFDLWPECDVESGDADGNHRRVVPGPVLERSVRDRFAGDERVRIVKGYSTNIRRFPADSFDAIYVDGDHGYHGVRHDLMDCWRVLKDGGWLLGHDYEINPAKTASSFQCGVAAAVTDFCRDYAESVAAFGMDGCVSFAIQVHKRGALRRPLIGVRRCCTEVRNLVQRVGRKLAGGRLGG